MGLVVLGEQDRGQLDGAAAAGTSPAAPFAGQLLSSIFSLSQTGMAARNDRIPRGENAR